MRMQSKSTSQFSAVGFVVVHLREQLFALLDNYVAGGAGTVAATSMIEEEVVVNGDVEDRLRLAVFLIGKLAMLELECVVGRQKRQPDCIRSRLLGSRGAFIVAGIFCHVVPGTFSIQISPAPPDVEQLDPRRTLLRHRAWSCLSSPGRRLNPSSARQDAWWLHSAGQ